MGGFISFSLRDSFNIRDKALGGSDFCHNGPYLSLGARLGGLWPGRADSIMICIIGRLGGKSYKLAEGDPEPK